MFEIKNIFVGIIFLLVLLTVAGCDVYIPQENSEESIIEIVTEETLEKTQLDDNNLVTEEVEIKPVKRLSEDESRLSGGSSSRILVDGKVSLI